MSFRVRHDPREVLAQRDLHERIALVVAEPDVEARPMLLDEVRLEEVRLAHRVGDDVLDVRHLGRHAHDPRVQPGLRSEVRADPMAEHVRLAHVQDPAVGLFIRYTPGAAGAGAGRAHVRCRAAVEGHGWLGEGLGTGSASGRASSVWM
jgi:hypothetical protein